MPQTDLLFSRAEHEDWFDSFLSKERGSDIPSHLPLVESATEGPSAKLDDAGSRTRSRHRRW
jgi:hypothetical protein